MLSVSIGPLALPLPPLVLLAAVTIAAWVANRLHARQVAAVRAAPAAPDTASTSPAAPGDTVWLAMLLGLAAARLVHVLVHAQAYLDSRARLGFPMAPKDWAADVLAKLAEQNAKKAA